MKARFIMIALTAVTALTACETKQVSEGNDVTNAFVATYTGTFVEPDFRESYTINGDGTMTSTQVRQVGAEGTEIPYPTVCSFSKTGKISVIERSVEARKRYTDFASHVIQLKVDAVGLSDELQPGTTSNPDCLKYLSQLRSWVRQGGLNYSIYAELLGEDSFRVHTSGGGDYQEGGPRTPSTLDEVFTRIEEI